MDWNQIALFGLIAANIMVSYKGFKSKTFMEKFIFHNKKVKQKEYWRCLTAGFLHADGGHIIFNMLTLYFFGRFLIQLLGIGHFFLIYFVGIIFGSIFALVLNWKNDNYRMLGASAGAESIVFASIIIYPSMNIYLFFAIPVPGIVLAIGYILYSLYGIKTKRSNIAHEAHLGGAIMGIVVFIILYPQVLQARLWIIGLLLFPVLLYSILEIRTKLQNRKYYNKNDWD